MKTLILFALSSLLSTSSTDRARATATRGVIRASADVRGQRVDVTLRVGRSKAQKATLHLPAQCSASKVAKLMANEVGDNPDAFLRSTGGSLEVWALLNVPDQQTFEAGLAAVLERGRHVVGEGGGETRIGGIRVELGKLPGVGETTRKADRRRGTTTAVTGLQGGGFEVRHQATTPEGVIDETTATFSPGGGSTWERSLSFGTGADEVEVSQSSEQGTEGEGKGAFTAIRKGADTVAQGVGSSDPTKHHNSGGGGEKPPPEKQDSGGGAGGGGGETPTPDGGGSGGNDGSDSGSSEPDKGLFLTPEGTMKVPGLTLPDELIGVVLNWSRLGAAVTDPSPIGDDEGPIQDGHAKKIGPCGNLERQGFDPNPAYLKPNKQGWVTDPVPALHGSGDRSGRER